MLDFTLNGDRTSILHCRMTSRVLEMHIEYVLECTIRRDVMLTLYHL